MSHRILLVEDNPITRKTLHFALDRDGYHVLDAADGASALDQVSEGEPDLVLLDLGLPDCDSFELLAHMRAAPRGAGLPILACSVASSSSEDARARAAGFDDVIVKPIEPSRLIEVIRGYLPGESVAGNQFGAGLRALVVDDDPIQIKVLAYRLAEVGFETILAADGEEAMAQARKHKPDCIVSDVMMPGLDGFGLCRSIRADHELAHTLVVLATNNYVEKADRDLARKLGAADLLLRTPELGEILELLQRRIGHPEPAPQIDRADQTTADDLERERNQRVVHQLDKQVGVNARQLQRIAALAAELSVVNGISSALVHGLDIATAMDSVLAVCLDAGGVSLGALYLLEGEAGGRVHTFGAGATTELSSFFGRLDVIRDIVREGRTVHLDRAELDRLAIPPQIGLSVLIVPLAHRDQALGALLLASGDARTDELERISFAETVANQLALAFMLARGFELRAQSEARATRQATLLASIFDAVADGVVAIGPDGRISHWNAAATSMLGSGPVETGLDTWPEHYGLRDPDGGALLAADDLPLVRALRGERVDNVELVIRRPEAPDAVWLSVNARCLHDEQRGNAGAVAVFRDITADKKAQAQLMVSDRMASVGMLAAGVAHEINNPLAALRANLEFLEEDFSAHAQEIGAASSRVADIQESLREACHASERVIQIVKDLKIFSRAEEDTREPVDVEHVLDSSLRMAWNEIRHRATVVRQFGSVARVHATEARLGQMFLNLVVNAAQAIPEGHADVNQIIVTTRHDAEGWVVTEIRDTGPGMSPDVVSKLFTPFFTTKPAGQGTGLGLVICRRIVQSFGGRITVDSGVGRGTMFQISLPPYHGDEAVEPPAPRVARKSRRRGSVLVIDDDPAIGKAAHKALGHDHEVVVLASATEALERIEAGAVFDVILCDVMMPVISGVEFFHRLHDRRPELADRMVFLTGGAFTPSARAFLDQVANARIEKPFEIAHLRSLVNDRVDRRHALGSS